MIKVRRTNAAKESNSPALRISPTAWAKLLFVRDLGPTEVGGFGIAAAENLLLVEDIQLVQQTCTGASVAFDDQAVADFFDRQVDAGRKPAQFARIWVHTHPGSCPEPSHVDEETFARVFGRSDWALMFVLARGGASYARLQFHVGPGGSVLLPVEVDYRREFSGSNHAAWREEYLACMHEEVLAAQDARLPIGDDCFDFDRDWFEGWFGGDDQDRLALHSLHDERALGDDFPF